MDHVAYGCVISHIDETEKVCERVWACLCVCMCAKERESVGVHVCMCVCLRESRQRESKLATANSDNGHQLIHRPLF